VAVQITKNTVEDNAQVKLGAESVKHQLTINARGGEGSLVYSEGMGMLQRLYHGVNDGLQLDGYLVDLNRLERQGDKHIVCLWSGGTRHGDDRRQQTRPTKKVRGVSQVHKQIACTTGNRATMAA
jgi:hypothetical protein